MRSNAFRALFLISTLIGHLAWAKSTMYVYYPTEMRADILQETIFNKCSDLDVTVFGRAKDLRKAVTKTKPSILIAQAPVIQQYKEYAIIIRGQRDGKESEPFVLVSKDEPVNLSELDKMKIGVLDILGRKEMNRFVQAQLKVKAKISRVTKKEDLLPLLSFGSVDALFISNSNYLDIKSKTKLNLQVQSVDVSVGLVTAAFNSPDKSEEQKAKSCISSFDKDINSVLGVEQWKAL